MNETEKLIELIGGTRYGNENRSTVGTNFQRGFIEKIANHLLANGVRLETKQVTSEKTSNQNKRPIYAEDLRCLLRDKVCIIGSRSGKTMSQLDAILRQLIDITPTADVAPVFHGEWIPVPSSDTMTGKAYKCSQCGKMRYGSFMPNYCGICGAKMDGDGTGT